MRHRLLLLLVTTALAACGSHDDEPAAGSAMDSMGIDSAAAQPVASADPARHAPSGDPVIDRFAARVPVELLRRRGACPFECCVYGDWSAESSIPVHANSVTSSPVLFTLAPQQSFKADSGVVFVTGIAVAIVTDTVPAYGQKPRLVPGDTLVLLDPVGEGYWNMWMDGRVLEEIEGFFDVGPYPTKRGKLLGHYAQEWWVHLTMPDGRTGWIRADSARIGGSDACGG